MFTYEIRLMDEHDRLSLVYATVFANDDEAKQRVLSMKDYPYSRFEIWRDAEKIAEGR